MSSGGGPESLSSSSLSSSSSESRRLGGWGIRFGCSIWIDPVNVKRWRRDELRLIRIGWVRECMEMRYNLSRG